MVVVQLRFSIIRDMDNSPWWHHKGGFLSLKHSGRQMLGFMSEGFNLEHEIREWKVRR
jgi:hypothetical protein